MTCAEAITEFEQYVAIVMDEDGVYPLPMMGFADDDSIDVFALALPPEQAMPTFIAKSREPKYRYLVFALDRYTLPEQGNEFDSVLTVFIYERDELHKYSFGVIDYRIEPRTIRPISHTNNYWNSRMARELESLL